MDALVSQLFAGLSLGSVLLLAALGLALTFGQMGVINMAHGEFIMAGAYTAFVVQKRDRRRGGLPARLAGRSAFLVGGLLGLLLEITLISPDVHAAARHAAGDVRRRARAAAAGPRRVRRPQRGRPRPGLAVRRGRRSSASGSRKTRLFILALAVLCRGRPLARCSSSRPLGRRIRATVQNRDLAETSGISTRATDRLTFFVGSGRGRASPASRSPCSGRSVRRWAPTTSSTPSSWSSSAASASSRAR